MANHIAKHSVANFNRKIAKLQISWFAIFSLSFFPVTLIIFLLNSPDVQRKMSVCLVLIRFFRSFINVYTLLNAIWNFQQLRIWKIAQSNPYSTQTLTLPYLFEWKTKSGNYTHNIQHQIKCGNTETKRKRRCNPVIKTF